MHGIFVVHTEAIGVRGLFCCLSMVTQENERATHCSGRISQTTHSSTGVCVCVCVCARACVFVQCQQFLIKPEDGVTGESCCAYTAAH